ncbi:MAG TPA: MlaD family protein [Thermoleophilaceae bacterium]|nr:MlaD family protein [Thermoleophilaceae bacterium]
MHGGRFSAFQVGLVALAVIALLTFLGATKDIPFTKPYQLNAVFENPPPIQKNTAVRVAGVDVGKVSKVEPVDGDSPAVKVTMKLKEEALPLHEDTTLKVRPRIFFEGNVFIDVRPGTPGKKTIDDGHTIPASQTSAPVQIDQVLGTLKTDTREDLQKLLQGYGRAINGKPEPGEDDDQDPDVKGQTAGEALNDSLEYSADALRGGAVVNQAFLGRDLHDLSKLVAGQQKVTAALSSREEQLKDLITNFNTTMSALADEQGNLRETVRLLPEVTDAANPALDKLNAAFPSTRAWAREMIPGVRETPATLTAAFPWLDQTGALLRPSELRGLVDDLQPAVDDFAEFVDGQSELLPQLDAFNRCQLEVVLPSGDQRIRDGNFTTGLRNYQEFWQMLVLLTGQLQNFNGNGSYARFQPGGGAYQVGTAPIGEENVRLFGNATSAPLGTRPGRLAKPKYRPDVPCHRNAAPDLNSAKVGGGP